MRECEKQQNFLAQNLKGVIWVGCLFIFRDKGLLAVCLGGGKFKARDEETVGQETPLRRQSRFWSTMFSAEHQTGSRGLEILSPAGTGKDEKWCKFVGGVSRDYEREVKGYMYLMDKGSGTYIQCPASSRYSLGITQPLLVIQLQSLSESNLSIEVVVLDQVGRRHRLRFSNTLRRFESNNLHAQIPWYVGDVAPDRWTQVIFDLEFLTNRCFDGASFTSLDSFCLRPCVKVRNIFSLPMSAARRDSSEEEGHGGISGVTVPKSLHFATGVFHETKFFDHSIDYALIPVSTEGLHPSENASRTATMALKGIKSASRGNKLSVTGVVVPVQKAIKKSVSGGNDVRSSKELKKKNGTAQSQHQRGTTNQKSGKAITASRREKTAAKIKLMRQKQEEEKVQLNKQYRKEVASQLSPSHADEKRKVVALRRAKNRKLPTAGSTIQGSVYETLDELSPPQSQHQEESERKRSAGLYPNKTRPIPLLPKRNKLLGSNLTDSLSETDSSEGGEEIQGINDQIAEEEILVMKPAASANDHNPWEVSASSVKNEKGISGHEPIASVFPRLDAPTKMTDGTWLESATNHLYALTNELSVAEKEYMLEFGESPPK